MEILASRTSSDEIEDDDDDHFKREIKN